MISQDVIYEVKERLIQAAKPKKIILFGSYASGNPNFDSDLDIMVVEQSVSNKFQEMIHLRRALRGLKIPVDIVVIAMHEYEKRSTVPGTIYYWAKKDGKILYEEAA
ncbi:MAG: nucleotidyltransferase domain-containing protein [Deltaproteobacteria bacterium]|nr:nucleotidyltransferase domain-containing protein [Deltaproteobacteria bacterium]